MAYFEALEAPFFRREHTLIMPRGRPLKGPKLPNSNKFIVIAKEYLNAKDKQCAMQSEGSTKKNRVTEEDVTIKS